MSEQYRVLETSPVYIGFKEAVYPGKASLLLRGKEKSISFEFKTPIPVPDGGVYDAEFPTANLQDAVEWLKDTVKQCRRNWEPDTYPVTRGNSLWAL